MNIFATSFNEESDSTLTSSKPKGLGISALEFESRTVFAEEFEQEVSVFAGLEKTKDYCLAMSCEAEGAVINYCGQVLLFRRDPKDSSKLQFEQNFKFPSKTHPQHSKIFFQNILSDKVDCFKDIVYYPAIAAYVLLEADTAEFRIWKLEADSKRFELLATSRPYIVKYGNVFKVSRDGRLLYINYQDFGIQIFNPDGSNFRSF